MDQQRVPSQQTCAQQGDAGLARQQPARASCDDDMATQQDEGGERDQKSDLWRWQPLGAQFHQGVGAGEDGECRKRKKDAAPVVQTGRGDGDGRDVSGH